MKPPVKDLPKGDAGLGQGPLAQLNDPPRRGMEIAGVGLSLVWVLLILVYVLVTPPGSETRTLGLVMTLLMVFLPGIDRSHWPRSPRALSGQLKRLAPGLRRLGLNVEPLGHGRAGSEVRVTSLKTS